MLDTIQLSFIILLLFIVQGVSAAMGAMDAIALVIGLLILVFGICAGIGYFARKRNGQQ